MIRYSTTHPGNTYSDATDAEREAMARRNAPDPVTDAQRTQEAIQRVREAMRPGKLGPLTIKRKHAAALGGRKDLLT